MARLFLIFSVTTALYAQTPLRIAPEININDTELAPAVGNQSAAGVASDGTDFYVAWEDSRGGGAILGTKITAAGEVVSKIGDVLSNAPGDHTIPADPQLNELLQSPPRVEWDEGAYLVSWSTKDGTVHFTRVERDGTVTQRDVHLPGTAVASDGRRLLATSIHDGVVHVRLYSLAGESAGDEVAIPINAPVPPGYGYQVGFASVMGNPSGFLVSMSAGAIGPGILGLPLWMVRVDENGKPGTAVGTPGAPLAWNGASALTVSVTTNSRTGAVISASTMLMYLDGTHSDPITGGVGPATWNGSEYVALGAPSGSPAELHISADGHLIRAKLLKSSGDVPGQTTIGGAIASNGRRNLLVISRTKDIVFLKSDLFGRFTDDIENEFVIAWSPRKQTNPAVVSNGTELLISWSEPNEIPYLSPQAFVSRVAQNGQHLDGRGILLPGESSVSLGSDGESFVAMRFRITHIAPDGSLHEVWPMQYLADAHSVPFGSGQYAAVGQFANVTAAVRLTPYGLPIDQYPIYISPSVGLAPQSVWDGHDFFIAWHDSDNHQGTMPSRIVGALFSPAGVVVHAFYIAWTETPKTEVALATNDDTVFVAYKNSVETDAGAIYGKLMSRDGNVLAGGIGDGIAISPSAGQHPSVAWDGAAYVVTWASADGIMVRRFDRSGSAIDEQPIVMTRSSTAAQPIAIAIAGHTAIVYTREDETGPYFGVPHVVVRFVGEPARRSRAIR